MVVKLTFSFKYLPNQNQPLILIQNSSPKNSYYCLHCKFILQVDKIVDEITSFQNNKMAKTAS
jgi:hypothetical protein